MVSPQRSSGGAPAIRRRVFSLPTLASLGLAGLFLWFLAFRFDVDLQAVWLEVRSSQWWLLALAAPLHYTTFIFRGARLEPAAAKRLGGRLPGAGSPLLQPTDFPGLVRQLGGLAPAGGRLPRLPVQPRAGRVLSPGHWFHPGGKDAGRHPGGPAAAVRGALSGPGTRRRLGPCWRFP